MVREWYLRRSLQLLIQERDSEDANPPAPSQSTTDAFQPLQNIHQKFDFVVTCR